MNDAHLDDFERGRDDYGHAEGTGRSAGVAACEGGLFQMAGVFGDATCRGGLASSSGTCVRASPAGGLGQRVRCGLYELIGKKPCDKGLKVMPGCSGNCFCDTGPEHIVSKDVAVHSCVKIEKIADGLSAVRQLGAHGLVPLFLILEDYRSLS